MKKELQPYRRRLAAEALARSLCLALTVSLSLVALTILLSHILYDRVWTRQLLLTGGGALILVCAMSYLLRFRPDWAYTAQRIDEIGLGERITAMLMQEKVTTDMARLQRQDALRHLALIRPNMLPLRLSRRNFTAPLTALAAALLMCLLPYFNLHTLIMPAAPAEAEESPEAARIRAMLEEMRAQIEGSALSEEEKRRLLQQLEELAEQFDLDSMSILQMAALTELNQSFELDLLNMKVYGDIVSSLYGNELLHDLGMAIIGKDSAAVRLFFGGVETAIMNELRQKGTHTWLLKYINEFQNATSQSEDNEQERYLINILDRLTDGLGEAVDLLTGGADAEEEIHTAIYRAQETLCLTFMQDAQGQEDEQLENSGERSESTEDGYTVEKSGMSTALFAQGTTGVGLGTGENNREQRVTTEPFYEPALDTALSDAYSPAEDNLQPAPDPAENSGMIEYGQVYGLYYYDMLEKIMNDQLPADMVNVIENYFYDL